MKQNFSLYYHSRPNLKILAKEYSRLTSNGKNPIIKNKNCPPWVKIDKGKKASASSPLPAKESHKHHWQASKTFPREHDKAVKRDSPRSPVTEWSEILHFAG